MLVLNKIILNIEINFKNNNNLLEVVVVTPLQAELQESAQLTVIKTPFTYILREQYPLLAYIWHTVLL